MVHASRLRINAFHVNFMGACFVLALFAFLLLVFVLVLSLMPLVPTSRGVGGACTSH